MTALICCEICKEAIGAGCHCFGRGWKNKEKDEAFCLCIECQMADNQII